MTYPRSKNWGDVIEFRGCVPRVIPKHNITVDPPVRDLTARDAFCEGKSDNIYRAVCTLPRFQVSTYTTAQCSWDI